MFSGLKQIALPASLRFVMVGACAAAVHYCTVVILVEWGQWPVLVANVVAFLIAFCVSFSGHAYLTFSQKKHRIAHALPRFFLVASCAFAINEILLYGLLSLGLPYQLALIMVLLFVAAGTFVVSKYWAFR